MEADLHNLWPAVGEVNGMRKNYSMAELGAEKEKKGDFGKCTARVRGHKFEPIPKAKGRVARIYMYMDSKYPGRGIISSKTRAMFEAWDKRFPPDAWECKRAAKIMKVSGQENKILTERCLGVGK